MDDIYGEMDAKYGALRGRLQPTGDVLIVVRSEMEETRGGIAIPKTTQRPGQGSDRFCRRGYVVAAGPGRYNESAQAYCPMPAAEGDVVLFSSAAGFSLGEEARLVLGEGVKGTEVLFLRAGDLFAVVNRDVDGQARI